MTKHFECAITSKGSACDVYFDGAVLTFTAGPKFKNWINDKSVTAAGPTVGFLNRLWLENQLRTWVSSQLDPVGASE